MQRHEQKEVATCNPDSRTSDQPEEAQGQGLGSKLYEFKHAPKGLVRWLLPWKYLGTKLYHQNPSLKKKKKNKRNKQQMRHDQPGLNTEFYNSQGCYIW